MAKGEGFEPSIRDKPYTRLAGERLQPLGLPFIRLLFSSRFELLASPVARNERAFTLPFAFVQVLFFKSCIFFASPTANATFPPLSAISLGLFSGIWGRPISLSLNTGFWLRLFRPLGSIRLRGAAMCSFHCAHTPRSRPGVALRLPRAVFWRPFRALDVWTIVSPGLRFGLLRQITNARGCGRPTHHAKSSTPAVAGVQPPSRKISHLP